MPLRGGKPIMTRDLVSTRYACADGEIRAKEVVPLPFG
jgi:hypothetical protein